MDTSDKYTVKGIIADIDGRPLQGLVVKAYHKNYETLTQIGSENTTATSGEYKITFEQTDVDAITEQLNLVVYVFSNSGDTIEDALIKSPLIVDATNTNTINLAIGDGDFDGLIEYNFIKAKVDEKVTTENIDTYMNIDEAVDLASQMEAPVEDVLQYIYTKKLAADANIDESILYGITRSGKYSSLVEMMLEKPSALKEALQQASENGIIEKAFNDFLDPFIANLKSDAVSKIIAGEADNSEMMAFFTDAGLTDDADNVKKSTFLSTLLNTEGDITEFWANLRSEPGTLTSGEIDGMEALSDLVGLTGDRAFAVYMRDDLSIDLDSIADKDQTYFENALASATDMVWDDRFDGDSTEEKQSNYAQFLVQKIENAMPSKVFVSRASADEDIKDNSKTFFTNSTDFDFGTQPVGKYIADNDALSFITDEDEETQATLRAETQFELESLQRLYRVAPQNSRFENIQPLFSAGINSSADIVRIGRTSFIDTYSATLGEDVALGIYNRATQVAATTSHLIGVFNSNLQLATPQVIQPKIFTAEDEAENPGLPDLETLFGSQSVCSCVHCRSLYSTSAYMVDLLNWLNEVSTGLTSGNPQTLKEAIDDRRPEIQHILLSCENANTPLPYIDLVNEVLENAIASAPNYDRQTTQKQSMLKAHPEYIIPEVYNTLRKRVYPWSAPFDLFEAETQIYLKYLGIDYPELRKLLAGDSDAHVAAKKLEINLLEKAIITNNLSDVELHSAISGISSNPFPEYFNGLTGGAGVYQMSLLMQKSGLTFNEIRDYLESYFINPDRVEISFQDSECDPDDAYLTVVDDALLIRLYRFHKMRVKLEWSIEELDRVIMMLPSVGDLDDTKLTYIAAIQEAVSKYGISVDDAAIWWGNISTDEYFDDPSYFADRFVNPSVNNVDESYNLTDPTGTGTPSNIDISLSDLFDSSNLPAYLIFNEQVLPLVLAGAQLTEDEMELILGATETLSIENLSYAVRVSSFCKSIEISVEDYLKYTALFNIVPVNSTTTAATIEETEQFIELVSTTTKLGFSADQLAYIIQDTDFDDALDLDDWATALEELREKIELAKKDMRITGTNAREMTTQYFNFFEEFEFSSGDVWTREIIDKLISIMDGVSGLSDAEQTTYVSTHLLNNLLDSSEVTSFLTNMVDDATEIDPTQLEKRYEEVFIDDSDLSAPIHILQEKVETILWPVVRERAISEAFATYFELEEDVTTELITTYLYHYNGSSLTTDPFISLFADEAFLSTNFTTNFVYEPNGRLFHKMALIAKAFKLSVSDTEQELDYLFTPSTATGLPDFTSLYGDMTTAIAGFNSLWKIGREHAVLKSNGSLFTILNSINDQAGVNAEDVERIENINGWVDVDEAIAALTIASYATPDWYWDVKTLSKAVISSAVKPQTIKTWTTVSNTAAPSAVVQTLQNNVQAMSNACKAKNGTEQWLKVAPDLRNPLRIQQRDALADYLVYIDSSDSFIDRYSLYEHFLIDTEMDPCMMTTRIVQANGSIQLFVQRILMNLENPYTLDKGHVKEWAWRKNYRVWEANRKVFLYPENWIEPDLRDDKSELFDAFEAALKQEDLTNDTAKDAFLSYLESLDDIADMDVAQMFYDPETKILHVFGRTKSHPQQYYYRTWDDGVWTHWSKIDQDIEAEHLIPVVYNGRIILFWASTTKTVREENQSVTEPITIGDSTEEHPIKSFLVSLNWSELKNGRWSKRKRSKETVYVDKPGLWNFDEANIMLNSVFDGDMLDITVNLSFGNVNGQFFLQREGIFRFHVWNKEPEVFTANEIPLRHIPVQTFSPVTENYYQKVKHLRSRLYVHALMGTQIDEAILENPAFQAVDLNNVQSFELLKSMQDNTQLVVPHQIPKVSRHVFGNAPFFMHDVNKTYFIEPIPEEREITTTTTDYFSAFVAASMNNSSMFVSYSPGSTSASTASTQTFYTKQQANAAIQGANVWAVSTPYTTTTTTTITEFTQNTKYRFHAFDHKHVNAMSKQLNMRGLEEFFKPEYERSDLDELLDRQLGTDDGSTFVAENDPNTTNVDSRYPMNNFNFDIEGSYSIYNWELFFHAPLLIAVELTKNQKFEEAQKWFHFIFDPTVVESSISTEQGVKRFWRTKPFHTYNGETSIETMLRLLEQGNDAMEKQIEVWRENPFMPHAIARLRWVAYMKNVVMKYIDLLIAWADQLFTQDSMESINEATQIYLLAQQILGRRPELIQREDADSESYYTLSQNGFNSFSNALVTVENTVPTTQLSYFASSSTMNYTNNGDDLFPSTHDMYYFCVPHNDQLWGYWDTVADRLFKIRHCMNIEGVVRQLPILSPPIDPAMLVKAVASGLSIAAALNDMNASMPYYRFQYLHAKAVELTNDVKSLGASLLSALEKKDAEELSLIRQGQEINVLDTSLEMKKTAVEEAEQNIAALQATKAITQERMKYYKSRPKQSSGEQQQLAKLTSANTLQTSAGISRGIASTMVAIPDTDSGTSGNGALLGIKIVSGAHIAQGVKLAADVISTTASSLSSEANMAGILASQSIRYEDWQFQASQAKLEISQLDLQIQAAEIRKAMAEKDLAMAELQIENAKDVNAFMKDKWTNKELYGWMSRELSSIYFKAYQMAYDVAKKAEKAYHYEVGIDDTDRYISFGLWDSLKKGLLSGEKLHQDLKRLDIAYIDKNRREQELSKQVSLAMINPEALQILRNTGKCDFDLTELIYDLDHPGHYMRRIKSVSISIPCVTGPYTGVTGKLSLLKNRIRKNTNSLNSTSPFVYAYDGINDTRFIQYNNGIQSISTSRGQNDSGLFELNFNDSRYLPFEGLGAISSWRFELPFTYDANSGADELLRQFDYNTISDLIITVNYTAKDGGSTFKAAAETNLIDKINEMVEYGSTIGLNRVFSMKHEFPTEFYQFMNPADTSDNHSATITVTNRHFPHILKNRDKETSTVALLVQFKEGYTVAGFNDTAFTLERADNASGTFDVFQNSGTPATNSSNDDFGGVASEIYTRTGTANASGAWKITGVTDANDLGSLNGDVVDANNFQFIKDAVEDIILVMNYTA